MKHYLRLLIAIIFVSAPYFSSFGSTANKDSISEKVLSDTIFTLHPDTSNYLTLPIIVQQDSVPMIPHELIQDRLSCLESTIPLHYNRYVQGFIDYFTIRNRKYTRRVLERENVYFPLFEKYLTKHNLPLEFKYLSVVESALNPRAVSWAKAVGLWQFMSYTAGDFNLKMSPFVDERMDPEKSTEAACRFLKQLYRTFGDWELVMAAYNCGAGNVKKAIARSGGKKTFWEIFPYLPKETRSYVPTFTAVVYTMNHTLDHELVPDTLLFPVTTDTLLVNQSLDLIKLSRQLNLQADELKRLNPAVVKGYLPETIKNYPLRIPAQTREILALNRTAIMDSSRMPVIEKLAPIMMIASSTSVKNATQTSEAENSTESTAIDSLQKTEYVVAKGDFLEKIARKHQVTIAQLKEWNGLAKGTIVSGQKLVIYKPAAEDKNAEPVLTAMAETNATEVNKNIKTANYTKKSAKAKKLAQSMKLIHVVQPSDTLWNISKKYNNVPVEQIKKLNKLKTNEIKPGQKLVIS